MGDWCRRFMIMSFDFLIFLQRWFSRAQGPWISGEGLYGLYRLSTARPTQQLFTSNIRFKSNHSNEEKQSHL